MDNLWPNDIGQPDDTATPVTILQEQAQLLGQRTQNIVTADVETIIDNEENSKPFIYNFYIVAPVLHNYRYRLITVMHDIELYPLHIYADDDVFDEIKSDIHVIDERYVNKRYIEEKSEEGFIKALRLIFSTKKAQRIVKNLLGQSKQFGGYKPPTINENELPF